MKKYIIIITLLLCFRALISASEDLKEYPLSSQQITKLHDILTTPLSFADKSVILEGIFAQRNCNYCFMYKEGRETVKITPKGFFTPKFNPGTRIHVKGIVRIIHGEEITIEALEVQKK